MLQLAPPWIPARLFASALSSLVLLSILITFPACASIHPDRNGGERSDANPDDTESSPSQISSPAFDGTWSLVKDRSTSVDPWRSLAIEMQVDGSQVTLKRTWGGNREAGTYTDTMTIRSDGSVHEVPMQQWPDNRHLGAFLAGDSTKQVSADWIDDGRTLRVETRLQVRTSQGVRPIRMYSEYRLSPDDRHLTLLELRSTRPRPLYYTFERLDG